ncbi:PrpF domain-containing protein [Paenibacillus sp. N3.4]|uniref:PrpF domain-containing protein n=1 Tax=Paenibacillus sp. N3.4 TaxID=2603222 RepID=UPI0011C739B2|nr:PrpF domain-containing protein [Paenibacillus sp. N3.4]TXK79106.1 PrpF protein [Paenibacillus sp. N3.4]
MSQFLVPCAVYRGGTSRGLFFAKSNLPEDLHIQKKIFLNGIDAYNMSQINGLGSGTSHTSKVCVISPSTLDDADVDYTFYQIGIGEEVVDDKGTCGNLMAAVGAFAIDEGLVKVDITANYVDVTVFNTNIKKILRLKVPVVNGKAKVSGDYAMPGIYGTGAKFIVDILSPGGGKTGKTLPVGVQNSVETESRAYEVSFVDVVNPFVYVAAEDLGIKGTELNSELSLNEALLSEIETIRSRMAIYSGMAKSTEDIAGSVPKIAIVTEPQDYVTSVGKLIKKEEVDIVAKMISMGKFHRTYAGSGLYNIAAAALLPGTLPNRFAAKKDGSQGQIIRIGHPEGVTEVRVSLTEDGKDVVSVGLDRTARRIMKGDLFIPE